MIPRGHLNCEALAPSSPSVDSGQWTVDSEKRKGLHTPTLSHSHTPTFPRFHAPTLSRSRAFTLVELLVVMAIIAILAAALGIVLAKLRTRAMVQRARSDIQAISNALEMYKKDIGTYPTVPYTLGGFADMVLYTALTDKDAGAKRDPVTLAITDPTTANRGWGDATDQWDFLTDASRTAKHFLDPWGLPYYYLSHEDYLRAVAIHDPSEDPGSGNWPKVYGTAVTANKFVGSGKDMVPPPAYFGPAPDPSVFFNPYTFQLHSKGPDQKTDQENNPNAPTYINPCDRGRDSDDINNWTRGASEN